MQSLHMFHIKDCGNDDNTADVGNSDVDDDDTNYVEDHYDDENVKSAVSHPANR